MPCFGGSGNQGMAKGKSGKSNKGTGTKRPVARKAAKAKKPARKAAKRKIAAKKTGAQLDGIILRASDIREGRLSLQVSATGRKKAIDRPLQGAGLKSAALCGTVRLFDKSRVRVSPFSPNGADTPSAGSSLNGGRRPKSPRCTSSGSPRRVPDLRDCIERQDQLGFQIHHSALRILHWFWVLEVRRVRWFMLYSMMVGVSPSPPVESNKPNNLPIHLQITNYKLQIILHSSFRILH